MLTNNDNGAVNECPYSFDEAGALKIELADGFDVKE